MAAFASASVDSVPAELAANIAVGAAATDATAPPPTLDIPGALLEIPVPVAGVAASAVAPFVTITEPPPTGTYGGGGYGRGPVWVPSQLPPWEEKPQTVILAVPTATVYASASAPILLVDESWREELSARRSAEDDRAVVEHLLALV
ncbi:MAG TPA: hypothetical protein VM344_01070 [Vitreimonas sp.]|nr:hypothetical protein [Vitreimonas sp.]